MIDCEEDGRSERCWSGCCGSVIGECLGLEKPLLEAAPPITCGGNPFA